MSGIDGCSVSAGDRDLSRKLDGLEKEGSEVGSSVLIVAVSE